MFGKNKIIKFFLPSIHTYDAAITAKTSKNKINKNVSKLFAVTRLTLYKIVFNNFPCAVLKPVRSAYAIHPLSLATKIKEKN
jgi:hypothetical protein